MSEHDPKPVGWFTWDEGNGYEEVTEQFQGEEWAIPLYPASVVTALQEEVTALAAHACIFLDGSGLTGDDHGNSICLMQQRLDAAEARANAAEQRLKDAKLVIEKQGLALEPLVNCVFNDNGDLSVSVVHITHRHCEAAYWADKTARAFIKEAGE